MKNPKELYAQTYKQYAATVDFEFRDYDLDSLTISHTNTAPEVKEPAVNTSTLRILPPTSPSQCFWKITAPGSGR